MTALEPSQSILVPQHRRPRVLYHYTPLASFLPIISSGHIWATHYQYLNDESEIKNFRDFLGGTVRVLHEKARGDLKRRIAPLLSGMLGEIHNDTNVYIASFSSLGDDLAQWRAYASGGSGVSIGFDSRALDVQFASDPTKDRGPTNDKFVEVNAFLEKVRYMGPGWEKGFFKNLERMQENSEKAASPLRSLLGGSKRDAHFKLLFAWLATAAPLYKSATFASEREWRIVLSRDALSQLSPRFRPGKSTLIPYVEAVLNRGVGGRSPAPYSIRRVFVGPTPNMSIAVAAIRSLFESIGHPEVKVEPSRIPFRHW